MLEGIEAEIDVKIRPPQMIIWQEFDAQNLIEGCLPEPREIFEWQEMLVPADDDPDPELVDVGDLSRGNGCATSR